MESRLRSLEGKYEILGKLHEGGMGVVYKVRHRLLDQVRVIKVMHPQLEGDTTFRERFLHEAKAAVRLHHQNIAQIYDFSIDQDGTAYIVLEFIAGRNLHELQGVLKTLGVGVVVEIASQSLDAIGHLHKEHLVHRDISPDNLVVTLDSEGEPQVKLIDFGIAKSLDSGKSLTKTGVFVGKVAYASPEHFGGVQGDATVEPRSDLYSMAVVLYELLTGLSPVVGTDPRSILAGHLFYPPKAFSESDPAGKIPPGVRDILLTALDKEPNQRFRDAESFGQALRTAAAEQIRASRASDGPWSQLRDAVKVVGRPSESQPAGSTQQRLDALFPSSGTDASSGATDSSTSDAHGPEQVLESLAEARQLLAEGQPDQALNRVRRVLAHSPNHAEALQVKLEIEKAHGEIMRQLRTLRVQKRAMGEIQQLLDRGDIDEADQILARLRLESGNLPPGLVNLSEEVAGQKAVRDHETAAEKIDQAEVLMAERRPEDALPLLRSAKVLHPENGHLPGLIAKAEADFADRQEKQVQELALRKLLDRVDESLNEDRLADAETRLQDLIDHCGPDHEEGIARTQRVEALRNQRWVIAAQEELGSFVDKGRFEDAENGLADAMSRFAHSEGAPTAIWVSIEERIRAGREAMLDEVTSLLEKGDLHAARLALGRAQLEGARRDGIRRLERELEQAAIVESPSRQELSSDEPESVSAISPSPAPRSFPTWVLPVLILVIGVGVATVVLRAPKVAESGGEPSFDAGITTGLLCIDALPWVELVAIADAENLPLPLPADKHTPIVLELTAGTYTLTLAHPNLAQPRELEIVLGPGETVSRTVEIAQYSADRYFEGSW